MSFMVNGLLPQRQPFNVAAVQTCPTSQRITEVALLANWAYIEQAFIPPARCYGAFMTITALNSGPSFTRLSDFPWFPDNPNMNIMAIRAHAQNNSRATDVGEVLRALTGLKSGDGEGWHNRFRNLADAVRAQAEKAERENHLVTARQSYLRASTYFRMSSTFIPRGARSRAAYELQAEGFAKFAALSDPPIERVKIPYDGIEMGGWYMPPKKKTGPKN